MIKSSKLVLRSYRTTVKNSVRSNWLLLLILFLLGAYAGFFFYDEQILSFVLPYLPREPDKSLAFYRDLLHLAFSELLWISGFLLLTWVFGVYVPLNDFLEKVESRWSHFPIGFTAICVGVSFIASIVVADFSLEKFANSSDEYVYLYQAETMSKGKLWEKAHPLSDFFHFNHIAQKDGIQVGRFPPGWPAILAGAIASGIPPYLVNPILGLLSLILFYFLILKVSGSRVALWSLPALSLSSFYIFNSASFFSHSSCLLCTVLFVLGVYLYREKEKFGYLVLAGFALGVMMTIRYYTALLIFVPFFFVLFYHYRLRAITIFFWMGLGASPCMAAGFWYNYSITGNPFLPVTMWAYQDESLGFVKGHTVVKGIEHIVRWLLMFVYWCSPAILALYFFFLAKKLRSATGRLMNPEDYFFALLLIGYFFYYEVGGNQYGPRFFFEALPFMILLVVRKIIQSRARWAMALFFAGMIYGIVKIPFIVSREHRVVRERNDLFDQVKARGITNAVIFISGHTGVIRPMPAGDLTRNDTQYKNDVLYALDLKEKNTLLMDFYPERKFYRYEKDKENVEGRLVRLK